MIFVIPEMRSIFDRACPNASAASVISQIDDSLEIVDLNFESDNRLLNKIDQHKETAILISCMVDSYGNAEKIAQLIKSQYPKTKIAVGGPHITLMSLAGATLNNIFDFICVGEFEEIYPLLFERLKAKSSTHDRYIWNKRDNSPLVSKHKWSNSIPRWEKVLRPEHIPLLFIEGSRGCPFHCKFCSHSDLSGIKLRTKQIEYIIREISNAQENLGIRFFRFTDSQLTYPPKRFKALCLRLKEYNKVVSEPISWVCFGRLKDCNPGLIETAAEAGCIGIFFGIESPKRHVLQEFGKDYNIQLAKESIKTANKSGILTFGNYIFGLPNDRFEEWELFVKDIINLKLMSANVNPFYLTPYSIYAKYANLYEIKILSKSWLDRFHFIFANKEIYFQTYNLTQERMLEAIQNIRERIVDNNVLWNLKDYHLLAWRSLGGTKKSLLKIWNQIDDYPDDKGRNCLLEMKNRGSVQFGEKSEKHFKDELRNACISTAQLS